MKFHGREAAQIENGEIRVTVVAEGGHIAEMLHKKTGANPLWIPPWPSIEPSTYSEGAHPEYGRNSESKLLAGIMGHNLCLDLFGPPSAGEAAAGLSVHGEASVVRYGIETTAGVLRATADLPLAGLQFTRAITLLAQGTTVHIAETVENVGAFDRPIAWTQHVTLGPPFLQNGKTRFTLQPLKSRTFENPFGASSLQPATDFSWPQAPLENGGFADLSTYTQEKSSSKFTTHLLAGEKASFTALDPFSGIEFGYRWNSADFPWLGIWEENRSRKDPPWNGETVTCGFEFGVSPFPETRRQMIDRATLFGVPAYRWIPAGQRIAVEYSAFFTNLLQSR
jgi:hypothetical protein